MIKKDELPTRDYMNIMFLAMFFCLCRFGLNAIFLHLNEVDEGLGLDNVYGQRRGGFCVLWMLLFPSLYELNNKCVNNIWQILRIIVLD